jgi:hypothetical protein
VLLVLPEQTALPQSQRLRDLEDDLVAADVRVRPHVDRHEEYLLGPERVPREGRDDRAVEPPAERYQDRSAGGGAPDLLDQPRP